jgi:hypothetical protein
MRSEDEIKRRLRLWKKVHEAEKCRIDQTYRGEKCTCPDLEKLLLKLGYGFPLISDDYYDEEAVILIINELKWVLGEGDDKK